LKNPPWKNIHFAISRLPSTPTTGFPFFPFFSVFWGWGAYKLCSTGAFPFGTVKQKKGFLDVFQGAQIEFQE